MKLALTLPASSYPEDALARVTIRLENVSRKVVQIGSTSAAICAQWGPGVQVGSNAGQILYPPATAWLLPSCGSVILPQPLLPGQSIQRRLFAILRGNRIRAVATIGRDSKEIRTPWLAITLLPEPPPHVTLGTSPPSQIDVTRATAAQRGRFYYMDNILCSIPGAQGQQGTGTGSTRFQFKSPPRMASIASLPNVSLPIAGAS